MKASEIIQQLLLLIDKYGDLDVLSWSDGTGSSYWQKIDMVEISQDKNNIFLNIDWNKQ